MSDALNRYKNKEDEGYDESQADAGAGNTAGDAQDNLASSRFWRHVYGQVRSQGAIDSRPIFRIAQATNTIQYLEGLDMNMLYRT